MEEMTARKEISLPEDYEGQMTSDMEWQIRNLQNSVNMQDKEKINAYGSEAQMLIASFSDFISYAIDISEVGKAEADLEKLLDEINGYNEECDREARGFLALFKRPKSKLESIKERYETVSKSVDEVVRELQKRDRSLMELSRQLEVMYDQNHNYHDIITMIIYAGEKALEEEKAKLEKQQPEQETSYFARQRAEDYKENVSKFEKRLYDLKITRAMSIQLSAQIRLIQQNTDKLSESIKTTIITAVPLWKIQIAISLGMKTVEEGLRAVNQAHDITNKFFVQNSEEAMRIVREASKMAERGTLDSSIINAINRGLVQTLSSSCDIARKTIEEREESKENLRTHETELKEAIASMQNVNLQL